MQMLSSHAECGGPTGTRISACGLADMAARHRILAGLTRFSDSTTRIERRALSTTAILPLQSRGKPFPYINVRAYK